MTEPYESLGDICVIIPTYNEIDNIGPITARIRASVPKAHILIADDNSPDGTGAKADELAAADEQIHVMHRQGKEGLAAAYLAGFRWALDNGYEVIGETDADGSHQPEFLPSILNALTHADMVKGSRWIKGGKVINYPKFREYLSRGGSLYTNVMLGIGVKDPSGGYNFFRASMLRTVIDQVQSKGYLFQTELTILAKHNGFSVVEVPIEFPDRELGQSKLSKDIFVESLLETTKRGVKYRGGQLVGAGRTCLHKVSSTISKATEKKA
ncbi:MAG: polyprenol monophosphomannose synthase [Propionibacteriaceae bacterium]